MRRQTTEADAALTKVAGGSVAADCETSTLDFKEEKQSKPETEKMLAEAAICFANSAGGTIVLGIRDKFRGLNAFVGTNIEVGKVKQRIYELSRPPLNVEAYFHHVYHNVMIISVPQSSDIHSDTQGRAYQRINTDCLPMDPDQQARLREERRGYDWSSVSTGVNFKEASEEAILSARTILSRFTDERRRLSSLSPRDLFRSLGVIDNNGIFSRAGAILFCDPILDVPCEIIYQYRSTPGGEPKSVSRLAAPLVTAFSKVLELTRARQVTTPLNLPNGQQITIEDFPSLAVREALSNAVCHREYHFENAVFVDHSPETFVVTSPGPLVSGVTTSNIITTTSRPRNHTLAKAARFLGFAEELGRGVDRMYREMIKSGGRTPVIDAGFDNVRVTFVGGAPNTNIAKFVASLPEEEQDDTDTMIILLKMCSTKSITASAASSLLQKSIEESEAVLRRLSNDSTALLERTRSTVGRSAGTYRLRSDALKGLGAAVTYQRRTSDEIDRKVIAHITEYGRITNRTLQNVFDIHVFKARDIIADLAQRGIIMKVSEAERGNKVEWGPGESFPVSKKKK